MYVDVNGDGDDDQAVNTVELQGIIEADGTYIGGKPRKENKKEDREPTKRGRGRSKTAVIGAVERGAQVIAEVAKGLTGRAILEFIRRVVNVKESELMTDEYHAYADCIGPILWVWNEPYQIDTRPKAERHYGEQYQTLF